MEERLCPSPMGRVCASEGDGLALHLGRGLPQPVRKLVVLFELREIEDGWADLFAGRPYCATNMSRRSSAPVLIHSREIVSPPIQQSSIRAWNLCLGLGIMEYATLDWFDSVAATDFSNR